MLPLDPATGHDAGPRAPSPASIVPPQAAAKGGTFVRPGAVAWGEAPGSPDAALPPAEIVEKALAAVAEDPDGTASLLDELSRAHVWIPLPDVDHPVTDGSAVELPTVTYLGSEFVPCFTSAERLSGWMTARLAPHIVVPAAALAWLLPPGLGMALNPGAEASVPIYPEGVAYLAARYGCGPGRSGSGDSPGTSNREVRVGHPPAEPAALLDAVGAGLRELPAVREAARAWLSVPGEGEGLVISVALDEPCCPPAQAAVLEAVEHAVATAAPVPGFPVDVTFPGEAAPDLIDTWVAENAYPFYTRDTEPLF